MRFAREPDFCTLRGGRMVARRSYTVTRQVRARLLSLGGYLVGLLLLSATACGGEDSSPTDTGPVFESIAGRYTGALPGIAQGFLLNGAGVLGVTITQDAGNLTGSYAVTGTLTTGFAFTPFTGTGTVTGTLDAGQNPLLSVTVTIPDCPDFSASFSGTYDSANLVLTLRGPVDFWDANCDVVLTYPSEILLRR